MLNKSGINKGNAINYLAFIVRVYRVCTEKQSAVNPSDAIGGKEEPPLIVVLTAPYPIPADSPTPSPLQKKKNIFIFRADTSMFLFISLLKL